MFLLLSKEEIMNYYIFNRYISASMEDIIFYSKEILKFLKSLENKEYIPFDNTKKSYQIDYYLDDIKSYSLCITESAEEIKKYISFLENKLYLLDSEILDEYEIQ